jgi:hypothetical protein
VIDGIAHQMTEGIAYVREHGAIELERLTGHLEAHLLAQPACNVSHDPLEPLASHREGLQSELPKAAVEAARDPLVVAHGRRGARDPVRDQRVEGRQALVDALRARLVLDTRGHCVRPFDGPALAPVRDEGVEFLETLGGDRHTLPCDHDLARHRNERIKDVGPQEHRGLGGRARINGSLVHGLRGREFGHQGLRDCRDRLQ